MLKESEGKQAIKANTDKKALNTKIFSATHTYNLFFSLQNALLVCVPYQPECDVLNYIF